MGNPDLSEFLTPTKPTGVRCWYQRLDLESDRMENLNAALDIDSGITHAKIAEVLNAWGVNIKGNSVGRHRNGLCSCG